VKTVHCLGVIVMDALSGPLERYPVPRVLTQVTTTSIRFLPGGGSVNTATALAHMGLSASIFSKLGDDANGAFILSELARCGVETSGIRVSETDSTPFTFVGIHPDGERTFIHTPGANVTFTVSDLDLDSLYRADFLFYQDLFAIPGIDVPSGATVLAEARRRGVVTLLDPCWGFGPNREVLEGMLPHCDYFMPSADDMRAIYPDRTVDEIAEVLTGLVPGTVILKMGMQGCLVARGRERQSIPAMPANVVDTTGAGDCWDAGFLAGLVHGEEPAKAARLGCACAAFGIEAVGGASGVPSYEAVCARAGL
jgi:sugar/nucleoside kinase (ribokinase family)